TRRHVAEEAEEIAALTEAKAGFEDGEGLREIALPEMQIADAGTQYALTVEVIDRRGNAASLFTVLPPCGECATFGKGLAQGITAYHREHLETGPLVESIAFTGGHRPPQILYGPTVVALDVVHYSQRSHGPPFQDHIAEGRRNRQGTLVSHE